MVILRIQLNLCLILSLKGFYKCYYEVSLNKFENHFAFLVAKKEVQQLSNNFTLLFAGRCLKEKKQSSQQSTNFTTDVHTMTSFLMFEFTQAPIRFAINLCQLLHI